MSKLCPQCGAPVDEGSVKCEWCGAAIIADAKADAGAPVGKPCPQCGAPVNDGIAKCEWCGAEIATEIVADSVAPITADFTSADTPPAYGDITPNGGSSYSSDSSATYSSTDYTAEAYTSADPSLPLKSKVVAGVLAILLGGLGIHKFYLGQIGKGILYILFCWTYIPAIIALVEGIMILCKSDADFEARYNCRTK